MYTPLATLPELTLPVRISSLKSKKWKLFDKAAFFKAGRTERSEIRQFDFTQIFLSSSFILITDSRVASFHPFMPYFSFHGEVL